jgi:hypothetical protein
VSAQFFSSSDLLPLHAPTPRCTLKALFSERVFAHTYMIFPDPNDKTVGRLTEQEKQDLAPQLQKHGIDPNGLVTAEQFMNAVLLKAAKEHEPVQPGQEFAARRFIKSQSL